MQGHQRDSKETRSQVGRKKGEQDNLHMAKWRRAPKTSKTPGRIFERRWIGLYSNRYLRLNCLLKIIFKFLINLWELEPIVMMNLLLW